MTVGVSIFIEQLRDGGYRINFNLAELSGGCRSVKNYFIDTIFETVEEACKVARKHVAEQIKEDYGEDTVVVIEKEVLPSGD